MPRQLIVSASIVILLLVRGVAATAGNESPVPISVNLYWDRAIQRAGRVEQLCARLENPTERQLACKVQLILPPELRLTGEKEVTVTSWGRKNIYTPYFSKQRVTQEKQLNTTANWSVEASKPFRGEVKAVVSGEGIKPTGQTIEARFTPAVPVRAVSYVPKPKPVKSKNLIGAMFFSGWKPGYQVGWSFLEPYPERKPALGWYDESSPEVTDWHIKWALEHGVSFFMYCWFRTRGSVGGPVEQFLSHAIHEGLFKARYASMFKFCIMWENYSGGGVASLDDLMQNMMPYWMTNYFKRPGYLVVDNKPVLAIYDISKFADCLGGPEKAKSAVDKMRAYCVAQGFSGLYILSEHRQLNSTGLELMAKCGLDASFTYCWQNIPNHAPSDVGVQTQIDNLAQRAKWAVLPNVPTLGMGFDELPYEEYCGWLDGKHVDAWRIPPAAFETVCRKCEPYIGPIHRMVLLDNWNEWGEGHYISPCRQNGFGYLDAVREVLTDGGKITPTSCRMT